MRQFKVTMLYTWMYLMDDVELRLSSLWIGHDEKGKKNQHFAVGLCLVA
jgi:hypothetical protein